MDRRTELWFDRRPVLKGGPGSGHHGHTGTPGRGGSPKMGQGVGGELQYQASSVRRAAAQEYAAENIEFQQRILGYDTVESLKNHVQERLAEDLAKPIAIRASLSSAEEVLKEGRFKTQFETGTSGGSFLPEDRLRAEEDGLGAPRDLDDVDRPIYGYFMAGSPHVARYGAIEFVLKESVSRRATYTLGDSLNGIANEQLVGAWRPGDMGGWGKEGGFYAKYGVSIKRGRGEDYRGIEYIEAQIQGGVSLAAVSRIIVHYAPGFFSEAQPGMYALLNRSGIEVEYDPDTR